MEGSKHHSINSAASAAAVPSSLIDPGIFEPVETLVFGKTCEEVLHEEEAIFSGTDCG